MSDRIVIEIGTKVPKVLRSHHTTGESGLEHPRMRLGKNVGVRLSVPPLWDAAIAEWLRHLRAAGHRKDTIYTLRQRLERTARHIDVDDPWAVTADQLVDYFGEQDHWSAATRRGHRTTLRGFYEWAEDKDYVHRSPARRLPKVKPTPPNPMPAPDAVYHPALAEADRDELLMLELAAEHGLRRGEIAVAHRDDMIEDLLGWSLLVHGKGGKNRIVPLLDETAERMLTVSGYAFEGRVDGHISARWCGTRVNRLLPGVWTIHKLRHRAATEWWKASDHDLLLVARLLGHASVATTQLYVFDDDNGRARSVVAAATAAVEQRRRRGYPKAA